MALLSNGVFYANTEPEIARVVDELNRAGAAGLPCGLDTEFYGVEIGAQSTVARAQVHFISVAIPRTPKHVNARGVTVADAAVMGTAALLDGDFKSWCSSPYPKAVHNLPVDAHALGNHGILLRGGINTLALARWAWPDRARGPGFTLDSLGRDFLGVGKMQSYDEVFSEEVEEFIVRTRRESYCECGAVPCRKRVTTPGHRRLERLVETRTPKVVVKEIPLESVGPGHPKFPEAVAYAAQDAVLALGVYELATAHMERKKVDVPWIRDKDLVLTTTS